MDRLLTMLNSLEDSVNKRATKSELDTSINNLATVAKSGEYTDIKNSPTKVSAFNNDVGYIITEIDPTVSSWAKAATKPKYTPDEVDSVAQENELTNSDILEILAM
jgi:hypothetical protein